MWLVTHIKLTLIVDVETDLNWGKVNYFFL